MKSRTIRFGFALLVATSIVVSADAQEVGGVVRGNSNINVRAENVNTIAAGSNNVAKTSIGSIKAGAKGGNVTVDVKNVSNVVVGHGKKGCVNIGTKGADPDCQ
jgi:hypothetical protein